jgi:hypothetical protein
MILRLDNVIFDLRYAEKIWLDSFYLRIRFHNGKEEMIDLRDYNCRPSVVINIIYRRKNEADYAVHYPKLSEVREK